jgi:cytochrome c oxidase cbb3-type subunit III
MITSIQTRRWFIAAAAVFIATAANAQATTATAAPEEVSVFSNTLFNTLLAVSILLLLLIVGLSQMLQGAARYHVIKEKNPATADKKESPNTGSSTVSGILLLAALLLPVLSSAQDAAATAGDAATEAQSKVPDFADSIGGLDIGIFFLMLTVILVELLIAYMLWHSGMKLLKTEAPPVKRKAAKAAPAFIETLNASVALEEEGTIMLDHEYDGIRELDNNLPPWWKYGFYLTIVFSVVYLIHYHVSKTGPLQTEEYQAQMAEGERLKAEYRKTAANLVDETNVFQLTAADSIGIGKNIYKEKCVACHKADGGGGVGPNLTDNYWLHGGDIKSVFTTIKYGVTSKGMQAWQNDLSPVQMQAVASYILTLAGTNVPGGEPPAGILFNPKGAATDSTQTQAADSLKKDSATKPVNTVK